MESVLDSIYKRAGSLREETLQKKKKVSDSLNYTETQLMTATREMKEKIHGMVEDVEQRVSMLCVMFCNLIHRNIITFYNV